MKMSILSSNPEENARRSQTTAQTTQSPPNYIALPPTIFNPSSLSSASPSRAMDDPFLSPMYSPGLEMYHTAPSTPIASPLIEVPSLAAHQAAVTNLHISIPPPVPPQISANDLPVEDAFPTGEIPVDLVDDEGLSALEKIYLFARSQSVFHRLYIVHALPSFLQQVTPQEAIEYVLPLVPCLAMDEDERVKEALVAELVPVIWWFFTNCQVIPDDLTLEETVYSSSTTSTISVQAFTPILGTLLLNSNVGGAARYVVVNLLARIRKLNGGESGVSSTPSTAAPVLRPGDRKPDEEAVPIGLFGREERLMFEHELLQQVVIGMGRLDVDTEDDVDLYGGHVRQTSAEDNLTRQPPGDNLVQLTTTLDEESPGEPRVTSPTDPEKRDEIQTVSENVNPYFPVLPYPSVPSPGSSNASTPPILTDTSSSSSSSSGSPANSLGNTSAHSSPSSNLASPGLRRQSGQRHTSPRHSNVSSPQVSPRAEIPGSTTSRRSLSRASSASSDNEHTGTEGTDDSEGDQASVGRLSSMSLMAAVTASGGCADENTQRAFVREVERVSHDPVYWVRREASYALGALAKVVPDEVVVLSLVPLFDSLRRDSQSHVRHSALYALPGILSRLSATQRRSLALDTIMPLSTDESQPVRSGVLEALGEVIYTFHEDIGGPPEELVHLFLGRREDRRVRDGQQTAQNREQVLDSLFGRRPLPQRSASSTTDTPLTSFYTDPARPLICAFNYPAVALTLGRARWSELRETYLEIAENREVAVRRTLAASLGELAKIVGADNAEQDLLGVWWDAVRAEDDQIREKALECVEVFVTTLGQESRVAVVSGLLTIWRDGVFRGWRERKGVTDALSTLADLVRRDIPDVVRGLLRQALEDNVAAVREAAISALPRLWSMFVDSPVDLTELRESIRTLARSELYRRRMTFVACLQALVVEALAGKPFVPFEDDLWSALSELADDAVVGVRIGVARLAQIASERLQSSRPQPLLDLIRHLSLDVSQDVRSYVTESLKAVTGLKQPATATTAQLPGIRSPRRPSFATFSRPPAHAAPRMFPGASLPTDSFNDEIRRGLTKSASDEGEEINSSLGIASTPEEDTFARPARKNPEGSAELLSESLSKKVTPVPG